MVTHPRIYLYIFQTRLEIGPQGKPWCTIPCSEDMRLCLHQCVAFSASPRLFLQWTGGENDQHAVGSEH